MSSFEYRVIPAPRRGVKVKGARRPEDRFARAIEAEMNRLAAEGWEYLRSDTLPSEQKSGWFSRPATVFQTLLVFQRPLAQAGTHAVHAVMPPPVAQAGPAAMSPPAPAASRFTPLPTAPLPANATAPVASAPNLTLVAAPLGRPEHLAANPPIMGGEIGAGTPGPHPHAAE